MASSRRLLLSIEKKRAASAFNTSFATQLADSVFCSYRPQWSFAIIAAFICVLGDAEPAHAQSVTSTGELNHVPPGGTQYWTVGDDLVVGDTNPGTLLIDAGGTVNNNWGYVGNQAGGTGLVTVQGSDGSGNASTWTNNGQLLIGVDVGGNGRLEIANGGAVINTETAIVGAQTGSTGYVFVSGAGSIWTSTPGFSLQIGSDGDGTLEIVNGGVVRSGQGLLGYGSTGTGLATISGIGSTWIARDNIYVGFAGTGELNVLDGATVQTYGPGGPASAATIYLGFDNGGQGTVTVSSSTGNLSTLSASDDLIVGVSGAGTMTVEKGGLVTVDDNVHIGNAATSSGTLHLNGDATGRGVLETGSVIAGAGTVNLDLNGGVLRANRNEGNFLNGFAALTVGAEGAWFDTNAHDIGVSTAFTGTSTFNKLGAGTLALTGNSSTFTGNAEVQAGTLQVDGTLGGTMNVLTGARLTGIGQVGVTTNSGVIAPGHVGTLGTLTVAGNYIPAGGSIEIRTQLGDDSSPTDRLVITGSTAGTTPVKVTNFGGGGAQTTEGIKIIDIAGASTGTFTLIGNTTYQGAPAVVAGAYAYRLYQGGASTPADGDWYLRSALQNSSGPTAPPLYQPGVPTYEAYPQILLGLNGVPTLQQRVGNRFWRNTLGAAPQDGERRLQLGTEIAGPLTEGSGTWGRIEAMHQTTKPGYSTSGSDYKYDMAKMQFGLDGILSESESGKLVAGILGHYVNGRANTTWRYGAGNYGAGSISTDGYGVGGTLTWYGENGFYADGLAQATWYDSDLSARPGHSLKNENSAFGYALSAESGKRLTVNDNWTMTPQVQLIYSDVRFKSFDDVFGASVSPGKSNSLQGRLGLSLDYQASRTRVYGIANIYNEFLDGTSVNVGNAVFSSRNDRVWGGLGVGGTYNWNGDKYSVYGEVSLKTSLADTDSYGYGGTIGFRAKW
ncbi:MAG TPA: autotransporter outer membrane beta-barrel domain-containing protein [Rhodocyclaceae bacterium]|nr:autotransporter outer membrane beta-barrel domain-containing protein [Rhodocyclaceae bacterium]